MITVVLEEGKINRIIRALGKVSNAIKGLRSSIPKDLAEQYALEVERNILSQKLPNYPSRSRKYLLYKLRTGRPIDHWIYNREALEAIDVQPGPDPNSWVVWSFGIEHSKFMEYGGGKPTPIPVFKFTLETFRPKAASRVFERFSTLRGYYT